MTGIQITHARTAALSCVENSQHLQIFTAHFERTNDTIQIQDLF